MKKERSLIDKVNSYLLCKICNLIKPIDNERFRNVILFNTRCLTCWLNSDDYFIKSYIELYRLRKEKGQERQSYYNIMLKQQILNELQKRNINVEELNERAKSEPTSQEKSNSGRYATSKDSETENGQRWNCARIKQRGQQRRINTY